MKRALMSTKVVNNFGNINNNRHFSECINISFVKARNRHCLKSLKIVPNFPEPLIRNKMESVLSYNGATVLFFDKIGRGRGGVNAKNGRLHS